MIETSYNILFAKLVLQIYLETSSGWFWLCWQKTILVFFFFFICLYLTNVKIYLVARVVAVGKNTICNIVKIHRTARAVVYKTSACNTVILYRQPVWAAPLPNQLLVSGLEKKKNTYTQLKSGPTSKVPRWEIWKKSLVPDFSLAKLGALRTSGKWTSRWIIFSLSPMVSFVSGFIYLKSKAPRSSNPWIILCNFPTLLAQSWIKNGAVRAWTDTHKKCRHHRRQMNLLCHILCPWNSNT